MITISGLPRALNCDGSLVLPRAEVHSEYADMGTDEHEELARHTLAGTLPPRLARIAPPQPRVEVIVAINISTGEGRIVGEGGGRNYTPDALEVYGTADVIGIAADDPDCVVVIDWKTGYLDVDPAAKNWQLWGYALAVCRALSKSKARVYIAYTNQPGQPIDRHDLDWEDLASFSTRITELVPRELALREQFRLGAVPTTREGNWCRHCPSKHVCPSKRGLLAQVSANGLAVYNKTTLTKEEARAAVRQILDLEQLVKDAKKRAEVYVDENGPIDMGDGKAYGRKVRSGRRSLDGAKALVAIRSELPPDVAKEFEALAVTYETSQEAIERAARTLGVGKSAPAFKAKIMKRLEELDGITYGRDSMPIGEHPIDKVVGSDRLLAEPVDEGEREKEVDALFASAGG